MVLINELRESGATHAKPESPEPSNAPGFSRREAIGLIGAVGLASVAGPTFALGSTGELQVSAGDVSLEHGASTDKSVHTLRHAHWQALVGDDFVIEGAPFDDIGTQSGSILTLQQAMAECKGKDVHRPVALDRDEAISLLFLSESAEQLANATYTLKHARLGRIELFLHDFPFEGHPGHLIYEAILN